MEHDRDCSLIPQPFELRERRFPLRGALVEVARDEARFPEHPESTRAQHGRDVWATLEELADPAEALEGVVHDPELLHRDRQAECELEVAIDCPVDRSTYVVRLWSDELGRFAAGA